jgi:hypothetical protein
MLSHDSLSKELLFCGVDPLFSLIIFIYVAVVFLYMFYAFCWKEPEEEGDPDNKVKVVIFYIFYKNILYVIW